MVWKNLHCLSFINIYFFKYFFKHWAIDLHLTEGIEISDDWSEPHGSNWELLSWNQIFSNHQLTLPCEKSLGIDWSVLEKFRIQYLTIPIDVTDVSINGKGKGKKKRKRGFREALKNLENNFLQWGF